MIIILDDTFIDRHKFHNVEFLEEDKYKQVCLVYSCLKTTEINNLIKNQSKFDFFGYHKSLQLYNNNSAPLNFEENTRYREILLNKVSTRNISKVEFSRGLETIYESKKIDKDLFYRNLKGFLDYFIKFNNIEPRILFWGLDFQKKENMSVVQKALIQIRLNKIDDFKNNSLIISGIDLIYGENSSKNIINEWVNDSLSKNEIIKKINKKICS